MLFILIVVTENIFECVLEKKVFIGRVIAEGDEGVLKVSLRGSVVDEDGWKAIAN